MRLEKEVQLLSFIKKQINITIMKIYIRHMVSQRCKIVVIQELKKLELNYITVDLGVVNLSTHPTHEQNIQLIPYIGMGWAYGWDYKKLPEYASNSNHVNSVTFDAGIINRFRFSPRVALDIELSGKLLKDEFDQRTGSKRGYDLLGTASASLVFTVGKKAVFTEAILRDQSEIDNLNNTINMQRADMARLAQRPVEQAEPTVVVKEVIREVQVSEEPVNNVVLFGINKVKVESHQEVNVYNVAKYLKENPDKKVRVIGYTDKETGTAVINEKLSRQRAQNVADVITGKYGINQDRVIVEWEGQTNPPFDVMEWKVSISPN